MFYRGGNGSIEANTCARGIIEIAIKLVVSSVLPQINFRLFAQCPCIAS